MKDTIRRLCLSAFLFLSACGDSVYATAGAEPVCVKQGADTTNITQKMICKISGCPDDKIDAEAFSVENKSITLFTVRVKSPYAIYKLCMNVTAKDVLNDLSATAPVQFALARSDDGPPVRTLATAFGALGDKAVSNIAVDGIPMSDGSYAIIGIPNTPNGDLQALQWTVSGWIERLRNSYQ